MENLFDLIVIGAGTAGMGAAKKCKKEGWNVALIDSRPFGGTCALRGCDPKKILVGAAELMDWNQRMKGKGIDGSFAINWSDLIAFKKTFTERVSENYENSLSKAGIVLFHGHAKFVGQKQVLVEDHILEAKFILIATGAIPMPLSFRGTEYMIDSEAFLDLKELPKTIVFAGGGLIAFEFAHIAARAGSEVHIIEMQDMPLANFDQDLVNMLIAKSEEIGIRIHAGTSVDYVEKVEDYFVAHCLKQEKEVLIKGEIVVHGAGRVANMVGMDLEAGNIEYTRKGIVVNEYLQSVSNPFVYAAGDACASPGLPLTPLASMEGKISALNMLGANQIKPDYSLMPTAVFTVPSIGAVGLTEAQALAKGLDYQIVKVDMSDWYTYRRTNDSYAMAKVIVDRKTDLILGAHIMGGQASELINQFATAMGCKMPAEQMKHMLYAYPTSTSDIGYMLP